MNRSNRLPILADQIKMAHAGVKDAAKTAAERAIEAGHALIEAKALVKHGEWLPWLRDHCHLNERTAQLYMKIAGLGLESETVADLGLNAAAKTITLAYPDPFANDSTKALIEWRVYGLLLLKTGLHNEAVAHHCEWLRRNGWCLPSEWYSEDGDRCRKQWGMGVMPDKAKAEWSDFYENNRHRTAEDIDQEAMAIIETQPPLPAKPSRKRRRRKA